MCIYVCACVCVWHHTVGSLTLPSGWCGLGPVLYIGTAVMFRLWGKAEKETVSECGERKGGGSRAGRGVPEACALDCSRVALVVLEDCQCGSRHTCRSQDGDDIRRADNLARKGRHGDGVGGQAACGWGLARTCGAVGNCMWA